MTTETKPTRRGRPPKTNLTRNTDDVRRSDVARAIDELNGITPSVKPNLKFDEQSGDTESITKEGGETANGGEQAKDSVERKGVKVIIKKPKPEPVIIPPVDDPMVSYMRQYPQIYKVIKDEAGFAQFDISDLTWQHANNALDNLPLDERWLVAIDVGDCERSKNKFMVSILYGTRIYTLVNKEATIQYLESCSHPYVYTSERDLIQDIIAKEKPTGLSFKAIEGFVFGKFFGKLNFRIDKCGFKEIKESFLDQIEHLAKKNPNTGAIYVDYLRYHSSNEHLDLYLLTQMEILIQALYPQLAYLDRLQDDMQERVPRVRLAGRCVDSRGDRNRYVGGVRHREDQGDNPFWTTPTP